MFFGRDGFAAARPIRCLGALRPIHVVKQPSEIRRGLGRPRGWPSCPRLAGGRFPRNSRGRSAEWRLLQFILTPCGVRVPWRRTLRPSALRAAVSGLGVALCVDGTSSICASKRLRALALECGRHCIAVHARGHSAPGRVPVPPGPRACEARRRRRRTPLRLRSRSGGALE